MHSTSDWQYQEIMMCTDGVAINVSRHKIVKKKEPDYYNHLTLCPAHKLELEMHNKFNRV